MKTECEDRSRLTGERGAALVEFALIFPIFMTIVLGMFSGGLAYNQDISLTHAAREGARYASTLAKVAAGSEADWTAAVAAKVEEAAAGDLNAVTTPQPGHFICIALVNSSGTVDGAYKYQSANTPAGTPTNCYADGVTDIRGRVHIVVGRPGKIDLLFTSYPLTLGGKATARFEDPTP